MNGFFETASQKAQRLEEEKKARYRNVEKVIGQLQLKQETIEKECTALWNKAKSELTRGDKSAAASTLKLFKMKKVEAGRCARLRVMAENRFSSISSAADMQEAMKALGDLAASCQVDVDLLEENMEQTAAAMDDISDMNKVMERSFERENRRIERELENRADTKSDPLFNSLEASLTPAGNRDVTPPQKITEENVDEALKALLNA